MSRLPSLATVLSFFGAKWRLHRTRLLLSLITLGLALPPLRAATFGDFHYIDTGSAITITDYTGSEQVVAIPGTIATKPVTAIGHGAFQACWDLTSVTIPESVTSIGAYAFKDCNGLTSLTIPADVTTIGNSAFEGCFGLPSLTIPASVTAIGDYALHNCSGLSRIDVATANPAYTSVDGVLYSKARTTLIQFPKSKGITIFAVPAGVTSISNAAFEACWDLTSVTIPSSVTSIGAYAFMDCHGLTSVTVPQGVTAIGYAAFSGCRNLPSLIIPASVTAIGDFAFFQCGRLAGAIFLGNAPPAFGDVVFDLTAPAFTIYYRSTASGFTTPLWKGYPTQMGFPTYAQWIAGFGLDASAQLPGANPSGDGLPNLVKYALWLDPTMPSTRGQPVLVSENGQLVYRVTLSLLTTGITSTIQTSADLVNWDAALTTIESSTATTVTASVTLPTGTPRRFARLVVTQQ